MCKESVDFVSSQRTGSAKVSSVHRHVHLDFTPPERGVTSLVPAIDSTLVARLPRAAQGLPPAGQPEAH